MTDSSKTLLHPLSTSPLFNSFQEKGREKGEEEREKSGGDEREKVESRGEEREGRQQTERKKATSITDVTTARADVTQACIY